MEFDRGDVCAIALDALLATQLRRDEFLLFALARVSLFDNCHPWIQHRNEWRAFSASLLALHVLFAVAYGPLLVGTSFALSLAFVLVAVEMYSPALRRRAHEVACFVWIVGTACCAVPLGAAALLRVQLCLIGALALPRWARRSSLVAKLVRIAQAHPTLATYVAVNLAGAVWELHAGITGNSLALSSDAGHMFFDAAAALIAIVAEQRGERSLGAYTNGLLLLFLAVYVCAEAIQRFFDPRQLDASRVYVAAFFGLLVNVAGLWHLHPHDANARGAWLHMRADLIASLAVIASVAAIQRTGWLWVDPLASVAVAALVLASAYPQLKDASRELRPKRETA